MKTTTKTAIQNMKYYKSRNILIGIAIVLTTMLLLIVPTVGKGMIDLQFAAVNKTYPSWHALYRNVNEQTVRQLAVHHDISCYGLRSDAGRMNLEDAEVSMLYLDQEGARLMKAQPDRGRLPVAENEIVVSPGILEALGQSGEIGDMITVPFQIFRDGSLDFTETKEFRICGFYEDSDMGKEKKIFAALISETFLKAEIQKEASAEPAESILYRFLFQINDQENPDTAKIEEKIDQIAAQFHIAENAVNINEDYLMANYVDPAILPGILAIMMIIMLAGVITIYSIYFVSMNQKVREFGRWKAIGATKRQVKQIILREGLCVAFLAIPLGLIIGSCMVQMIMKLLYRFSASDNAYMDTVREMLGQGEVSYFYWWIYVLAAAVSLCTVYFSLVRPMHAAAKISEIEAMRVQGSGKKTQSSRKGYRYLTIGRLTCRNLMENKKKSLLTILSMAATGVFLMVVATVLSCADPKESADGSILGEYEISPVIDNYNREHPELKWSEIQKNHPLTDTLKEQIQQLPGVQRVDVFSNVKVEGGPFDEGDTQRINGVPQNYAAELEKGIQQGHVTYEELKSGDKVIADVMLLHWYPDLAPGDQLKLTLYDGETSYEKEFEIAAFGSYPSGMTNYAYLIMAKEAADQLNKNSSDVYFHIMADKKYDEALEKSLQEIVSGSGRIQLRTWKQEYDTWKSAISMTRGVCYAFLGILAVISVMNLINTMINSVHVRKKEIGILQAVGMSDSQLMKMLQMEGAFYTVGTLLLSIGGGSLAGYPVFRYAKANALFGITDYHYPAAAALAVSAALLLIQIILAACISKSVRRESLIERIRFYE